MSHLPLRGLLLTSLAAPIAGQLLDNTQIADINTDSAVVGSYSGGFASNDSLVWFRGVDAASGDGYRLWATDGTAGGTVQVTTVAINDQESVIAPNGDALFSADELGVGVGIWRSDGTLAGTRAVAPVLAWTEEPRDLTMFDGDLWFLAGLAGSGTEVWRTNLATDDTSLAFELVPGPASGAGQLFAGGGKLYVSSPGQTTLFSSEGTAASLAPVASFSLADAGSFEHHGEVGTRVIFNVDAPSASRGWWSSDGTAAGTFLVNDSFNTRWLEQAETKVYFTGGPSNGLLLLHETDGTLAGTLPVNLPSTTDGQRVDFDQGLAVGDTLYYGGYASGGGIELFKTSGAAAGAVPLANINPGGADSDPNDFVEFDGRIFFRAEDGSTGREIWVHDPIAGTTESVGDLFPGPFAGIVGSSPTLQPAANGVVFGQSFAGFGVEPGVTDGQTSGILLNIGIEGASGGSGPRDFFRLGNLALFQANDETVGGELFATDGTVAGTGLLADIDPVNSGFPGTFGSFPHHFVEFQGRAVFYASHPSFGDELWWSDGTAVGTELLVDATPGPLSNEPLFSNPPVVLGDQLYFVGDDAQGDMGLYRVDRDGNLELLMETDFTGFVAEFVRLAVVNDRVVFNANVEGSGHELWSTDGVILEPLADINPGPADTFFFEFIAGDSLVFFTANVGNDRQLWKTDGTPAGTEMFFSEPASTFFGAGFLATDGDTLYFSKGDPVAAPAGREPWVSDGTTAGTMLLGDLVPGADGSNPLGFTAAGDRVFFAAQSAAASGISGHFEDLWMTDGTPAGTVLVASLPSPVAGSGISDLWGLGADRRLLFSNIDDNGEEWWVSDGTPSGTQALTDIAAAGAHAKPQPGLLVQSQLVFPAENGVDGLEVHALPLSATGGFAATSLGKGCEGPLGFPRMSLSSGAVALGESFSLGVEDAAPGAAALWLYSFGYGSVPLDGACELQLTAPVILALTALDGTGAGSLNLQVPMGPALVGVPVDFQVLIAHPSVTPFLGLGFLSDVLEVVVGF